MPVGDGARAQHMVARLHLSFAVLGDANCTSAAARRRRQSTPIVADGRIEMVFYPVFAPNRRAAALLEWLENHPPPPTSLAH